MAASIMSTTQFISHSDYFRYTQLPQPPPSPLMEDSRCSLPSISKILGMVNAGSPTSEPSPASQAGSPRAEVAGSTLYHARQETPYAGSRPASNYTKSWQQRGMPPTPPMGTDAAFDSYNSPLSKPVSLLPGVSASSGVNPWQHHHYLNPSHGVSYAQNQDRYVCQTCNKAFSRPSSLRIHSHSHTGEKPFKCPHSGCGKAFSVRSNMKRHERRCHSYDAGSARTLHSS